MKKMTACVIAVCLAASLGGCGSKGQTGAESQVQSGSIISDSGMADEEEASRSEVTGETNSGEAAAPSQNEKGKTQTFVDVLPQEIVTENGGSEAAESKAESDVNPAEPKAEGEARPAEPKGENENTPAEPKAESEAGAAESKAESEAGTAEPKAESEAGAADAEDESWAEPGDESGTESEDESRAEPGDESGTESEDESRAEPGDESDADAEDGSDTELDEEPGAGSEDESEAELAAQSDTESEDESDMAPGDESGSESEDASDTELDEEPGVGSEDENGAQPGEEPGAGSGDESGAQPGEEPGAESGDESGVQPGEESGAGSEDASRAAGGTGGESLEDEVGTAGADKEDNKDGAGNVSELTSKPYIIEEKTLTGLMETKEGEYVTVEVGYPVISGESPAIDAMNAALKDYALAWVKEGPALFGAEFTEELTETKAGQSSAGQAGAEAAAQVGAGQAGAEAAAQAASGQAGAEAAAQAASGQAGAENTADAAAESAGEEEADGENHWFYDLGYKVTCNDGGILCVRFESAYYLVGSAHPLGGWDALIFNAENGKTMGVRDFISGSDKEIFGLAEKVLEDAKARGEAQIDPKFNLKSYESLDDFNIYVDSSGVWQYFGLYEAGSFADGIILVQLADTARGTDAESQAMRVTLGKAENYGLLQTIYERPEAIDWSAVLGTYAGIGTYDISREELAAYKAAGGKMGNPVGNETMSGGGAILDAAKSGEVGAGINTGESSAENVSGAAESESSAEAEGGAANSESSAENVSGAADSETSPETEGGESDESAGALTEIYGGRPGAILKITDKELRAYVLKKTGTDYDKAEKPLDWIYLEEYDAWYGITEARSQVLQVESVEEAKGQVKVRILKNAAGAEAVGDGLEAAGSAGAAKAEAGGTSPDMAASTSATGAEAAGNGLEVTGSASATGAEAAGNGLEVTGSASATGAEAAGNGLEVTGSASATGAEAAGNGLEVTGSASATETEAGSAAGGATESEDGKTAEGLTPGETGMKAKSEPGAGETVCELVLEKRMNGEYVFISLKKLAKED